MLNKNFKSMTKEDQRKFAEKVGRLASKNFKELIGFDDEKIYFIANDGKAKMIEIEEIVKALRK